MTGLLEHELLDHKNVSHLVLVHDLLLDLWQPVSARRDDQLHQELLNCVPGENLVDQHDVLHRGDHDVLLHATPRNPILKEILGELHVQLHKTLMNSVLDRKPR